MRQSWNFDTNSQNIFLLRLHLSLLFLKIKDIRENNDDDGDPFVEDRSPNFRPGVEGRTGPRPSYRLAPIGSGYSQDLVGPLRPTIRSN